MNRPPQDKNSIQLISEITKFIDKSKQTQKKTRFPEVHAVEETTHIKGNTLDHLYINKTPNNNFVYTLYFSNHDPVCVELS